HLLGRVTVCCLQTDDGLLLFQRGVARVREAGTDGRNSEIEVTEGERRPFRGLANLVNLAVSVLRAAFDLLEPLFPIPASVFQLVGYLLGRIGNGTEDLRGSVLCGNLYSKFLGHQVVYLTERVAV